MKIQFTSQIFREGRMFVAHTPELDVTSCATTEAKAQKNLLEAVRLFLDEAEKKGSLDQILKAAGVSVSGIGHVGNAMPSVDAQWHGSELVIRAADISQLVLDRYGEITRPLILNINALDVKMQNVRGFELSFGSQVGMSGGPVIDASTHSVLGMLSIGLPADANIKTQTFAISMGQIMERIV